MSKKSTKALASATLMSLVLTTALSAGPVQAAQGKVTRTSGVDRYATAASVATTNWTTSDDVVLVSGEGYADAVSASALAKKLNAPILLTTAKALSTDTKNALTTLKAKNVYVVGGTASVSDDVRTELKKSYTVTELGGANRYETNAKVAQKLVDLGVKADEVMMVAGEGFSDALSVAPIAAAKGQILLLGVNNADSMKSVIDFVSNNKSKVTVVGTENVINSSIYNKVNATNRVSGGSDRFDTNLKVLAAFKDTIKADKMYVANATGDGYADALVASAVAGKTGAPLILVDTEDSSATTAAIQYIAKNGNKQTDLNVVGGTGVVSSNVEDKINKAINGDSPIVTPGVSSMESTGLNAIKIVFDSDVDEDSAEDVSNYKIDGEKLTKTTAVATLEDDNRTVFITLADKKSQNKNYQVSVKDVLSADMTNTVPKVEKTVNFIDTKAPTLKSVKATGQNKLTVEFTGPVDMKNINTVASKFRIKDQNISGFGLDSSNVPGTTTPLSEIKDSIQSTEGNHVWARKVEFYFNTKLSTGSNTFKVLEGDDNVLVDAGGFTVQEETMDFNVDSKTGDLTDKDITAKSDPDGTLWVKFGREMDKRTALDASNYVLNNSSQTLRDLGATLKLKESDCTIKITGISSKINTGANNILINENVRDAYGNEVDNDTRVNFTKEKDETKPVVVNAKIQDEETIRLTFSKDIDATYAVHPENYVLEDSTGLDISSHIKEVKPANGATKADGSADDSKVWDIKMYKNPHDKDATNSDTTTEWRLTGSNYNLTVKQLADTTSNKNIMDSWSTTLKGSDELKPKVTAVYAKADNGSDSEYKRKAIVCFSEEMDSSSLTTASNYKFSNKNDEAKDLPSGVVITPSNDRKSVTIKFPSNYGMNDSSKDDDNDVTGIKAQGVKDVAGNEVDTFNNSGKIIAATGTVKIKENSYRMMYDGTGDNRDILVKIQYQGSIDPDTTRAQDFKIAGETPTSISLDGSDIVLRFSKDDVSQSVASYKNLPGYALNPTSKANDKPKKVDVLKYYAPGEAKLAAATDGNPSTKDIAGNKIATETINDGVYASSVGPKTTSDYWYATTTQKVNGVDQAAVVLSFDTKLLQTSGLETNDYAFTLGGKTLKPDTINIKDNNIIFLFKVNKDVTQADLDSFKDGASIKPRLLNKSVKIKSLKDSNGGNSAEYTPTNKDITDDRTVSVSSTVDLNKLLGTTVVNPGEAALATALSDAAALKAADYTADSYKVVTDAVTAAKALPATATDADKAAAAKTITDAIGKLAKVGTPTTVTGLKLDVDSTTMLGFSFLKISFDNMSQNGYTVSYDGTTATWSSKFNCFTVKYDGTKTAADFDQNKVSVNKVN
ncbi:cell wall-binding repeat-containing protein [Clostridium drakei]|uniref:Cell wall-binding repeat 2 family protein n=1 Tax=Clostridium drakei TaxID=332101 RepID=A0A2U8DLK7_9CLOT|nr:cell wall-binding repeat-containing protein [Clostridium drakei]AWI03094.1 cell wall-binding repeat 2 family protein [Clostridium drakei]